MENALLKRAAHVGLGVVVGAIASRILDTSRTPSPPRSAAVVVGPSDQAGSSERVALEVPQRIPISTVNLIPQPIENLSDEVRADSGEALSGAPLPPRPYVDETQIVLQLSDVANAMYQSRDDRGLLELGFDVLDALYVQAMALFRDSVAAQTPPEQISITQFSKEIQMQFTELGSAGVFSDGSLDEVADADYYYADNQGGIVSIWRIDPTSDIGTLLTTYLDARKAMAKRDAQ